MSQMALLPNRERLPLGQPTCSRCGELIDVFAQFVCDECRKLYIGVFFGWSQELSVQKFEVTVREYERLHGLEGK